MTGSCYGRARRWLFELALPFWSAHGIDRELGGYVEELLLDGSDAGVGYKRVRVIARQIYVFSHASLLGVPGALEHAHHGFEYLISRAWLGDEGGWARRLDRGGKVIDATPDLYDLAFVLYALGWYGRASGSADAAAWARRTATFITTHMRHAHGGFLHEKPGAPPMQQNPHMHLLEAALVNLEATGDALYRALADEVVALCLAKLYDAPSRTLVELFDAHWHRLPQSGGRVVEPGHHFEWAWILASYRRLTGAQVEQPIQALIEFAEAHGVDRISGSVINAVDVSGAPINAAFRVWPNTERLQAAVAAFEVFGVDPRPVFEAATAVLFRLFLDPALPGTWIDRANADGAQIVARIPASTLYHLMIAFAEMLRVEAAVEQRFGPRA